MAGRRKRPRIYDEKYYRNFGEQPNPLELQLGYGLIPLVDQELKAPLLEEISYVRNQIDGEYGLPLPKVRIRDNMCLEAYEYKILLHGVEVGGYEKCNPHYVMCLDTGAVTEEISGEKTRDPAFDIDAVIIPYSEKDEAQSRGYVIPEWPVVIRCHLYKIIRKNITKFLDQSMVNTLINKIRFQNPVVIDDIFFKHDFSTSDLKLILNWLLEEGVSIRDMNTILETIADNLKDKKKPVELMEKVREKLAYPIILNLAEDKRVHVLRISQTLCDFLTDHIVTPKSRTEVPYFLLESCDAKRFDSELGKKMKYISDKGYRPVFITASSLRTPLSNWVCHRLKCECAYCITDVEATEVYKDFDFSVEGELELNKQRKN